MIIERYQSNALFHISQNRYIIVSTGIGCWDTIWCRMLCQHAGPYIVPADHNIAGSPLTMECVLGYPLTMDGVCAGLPPHYGWSVCWVTPSLWMECVLGYPSLWSVCWVTPHYGVCGTPYVGMTWGQNGRISIFAYNLVRNAHGWSWGTRVVVRYMSDQEVHGWSGGGHEVARGRVG
jgi:hypothetical protein